MLSAVSVASMEGQPSGEVNLFLRHPSAAWIWKICVSLKKKKEKKKKPFRMNSSWLQSRFVHSNRPCFSPKAFFDRERVDFSAEKLPKACLTENH